MQPKPEALVSNSFHWVAENPQKLDLAPIVLSNVKALLAALPDHSPLRRPILGYLLQGAHACSVAVTFALVSVSASASFPNTIQVFPSMTP
jgi:hypothetical protein